MSLYMTKKLGIPTGTSMCNCAMISLCVEAGVLVGNSALQTPTGAPQACMGPPLAGLCTHLTSVIHRDQVDSVYILLCPLTFPSLSYPLSLIP